MWSEEAMSAESRAKEICEKAYSARKQNVFFDIEEAVVVALREARREGMEEAAKIAEKYDNFWLDKVTPKELPFEIAEAIRKASEEG